MPSWPLVGRREELDFVVEALLGGRAGGLVLAGALGVGKTRLAREAAAAVADSTVVEWIAATSSSALVPFGAVAHLIEDVTVRATDDRLRIVRGVRSALQARAGDRPLVLAVDDAQWLDPGTAALVHQLVVTGSARALLTVRTDEPSPDPIVACWKDGLLERLELQALTPVDVSDFVMAAVGRPVDHLTLRRFWSLSEGNPLFLHEVVRSAIEAETFSVRDGVWTWDAPVGTFRRLGQILDSRLARLSAAARDVLEILAVGQPLPLAVLTRLKDARAVAEVERLDLIVTDDSDDQAVRLSHPLYGQVLLAAMDTITRRALMAHVADAMVEGAQASPALRLRLAVWRLESGSAMSSDELTEAAEVACGMYDHVLAERLARRALADGEELRTSLVLGEALCRQGRFAEGLAVLDPLVDRARTDQERVAIASARYFALTSEHGFRPEFADVVLTAERQVSDPGGLAFLRAQRAALLCSAGQIDEGVQLALRSVEEHPDEATELRAVSPLVSAWLCSGRADQACAMTARMLEPAIRLREQIPQAPGWVMSLHLPGLVIAGRLDEADDAISSIETIINSGGGSAEAAAFIALTRGMSSLQRGRVRTAVAHLRESVALLRPFARWRLPFALVQLVEAAALAGDARSAAAASEEADRLVANHAVFEGVARRARGWVALAAGERSAALGCFLDAAAWAQEHGQHTAELFALHDAVRFGAAREAVAPLRVVADRSEGRWAPVLAAHAQARADRDGTALLSVASDLEGLGALLLAAEACAHANEAFSAQGMRSPASRAAGRAVALAASCEDARSPVLDELDRPLPLTRREREVAGLAAQGLSSQAVAERLFVSVRTVEGHLQNAYEKLGVHDRAGLAAVIDGRR